MSEIQEARKQYPRLTNLNLNELLKCLVLKMGVLDPETLEETLDEYEKQIERDIKAGVPS